VVEFKFVDFPAQGIAVDSEVLGSLRLVSVIPFQNSPDEPFFEFADGFLEGYPAFHHLID